LIRCFNIREGLRPEDDNLPERLYKKSHKTNSGITEDELTAMLKDYYNLRGWNQNGLPKVDECINIDYV
jgi:aldehyde:ferredoxin oxidoreductase